MNQHISIHAPRGGSDNSFIYPFYWTEYFNPRSPWGERPESYSGREPGQLFQSTLPVGGATAREKGLQQLFCISIHAPRGGSDWSQRLVLILDSVFQSTLPVGGATPVRPWNSGRCRYFNPRSPWGERPASTGILLTAGNFNPRSPWGERPVISTIRVPINAFQSTLPVGGATSGDTRAVKEELFQSTLPVGGATNKHRR